MKTSFIARSAFLLTVFAMSIASAQPTEETDEELVELAKTAILGVHFDRVRSPSVFKTNGVAVVTFPRKFFGSNQSTNGIDHAATVWIDESTRSVLPNPELIPLSDERALYLATNSVPIPFDNSKTVRVDRASSLTLVTLPDKDRQIAPDVVFHDAFLCKIWIDTATETIVDTMRSSE
ncbi:MAG: hypothetical protein IJV65_09860 [Kiritimatiellae bacterium]|nr:hypothetical protein [Kiritimatiellia bacterium]